jgi:transcriptional regulator with XRE-family HTH domain
VVSQRRPPEFVKDASERLKKVRLALGLSQIDFCRKLEIKTRAYSQWETGKQLIDPVICARLSEKFSVTMDYIYRGVEAGLSEEIRKKL